MRAPRPTAPPRNPYEPALLWGGVGALLGGIALSVAGRAAYEAAVLASSAVDGEQIPDATGLAWAEFGTQLSTVGVVVLIGLAFYFMARWNARHGRGDANA